MLFMFVKIVANILFQIFNIIQNIDIYSDNKTCREIAAQIQYKKKLEAKPILKKCRTFYQTLQKNASLYGGKHIERYENFKKESKVIKKLLRMEILQLKNLVIG